MAGDDEGSDLGTFRDVRWSPAQAHAARLAEAGHNLLLSGSGGAGKSFLLRYIIAAKRAQGKTVQVTGSTGMAAVNVGGTTLHRVLGCGLGAEPLPALQAALGTRPKVVARWRAMDVLVVDEISMVDAEFFHKCDQLARWMRGRMDRAFGGIQVILVGDFAQLPAIVDRTPAPGGAERPQFCFELPLWTDRALALQVVDLRTVFRQKDDTLVGALNRMRLPSRRPRTRPCLRRASAPRSPPTTAWSPHVCARSSPRWPPSTPRGWTASPASPRPLPPSARGASTRASR
ncbi:P-loop NTPase incomplete domain containing protein [Pandoravirus celtis]|uniref:P-loop NTPase incomplete domain containing protein n=1 Tax=Pandoravirus celtis TaxID=2568002 RepID=A0A4D6EHJ9_9VIRU|nr:P-loop NTPase incomplete domain containing protein [Pandoravirus celtis]